jgi:hypothetical protein
MKTSLVVYAAMMSVACGGPLDEGAASGIAQVSQAQGGSGTKVDTLKVSKCFYNSGGEMLIKAASSDATATLSAYRPDGTFQGYVQNGGGGRYGGTVMPYMPYDPGTMTITSSSGGSITVPTTPFQL